MSEFGLKAAETRLPTLIDAALAGEEVGPGSSRDSSRERSPTFPTSWNPCPRRT
jgi:hypothetical protein